MTEHEVERALGYTPCICGVIDGTWHGQCYLLPRTPAERKAAYKRAFDNARRHLEQQAKSAMMAALKGER